MDDFKKELKMKKEMLYNGKSSESTSKQVDKFYFCDFSAKKGEDEQEEGRAIEKCLKVLREKSQKLQKQKAVNLFKKKKEPNTIERSGKKNSREINLFKEDKTKKTKLKDTLTLKSFLKNKAKLNNLKNEIKTQKKFNRTEVRKSSMMKNQDGLQDSLRKYLPKGFKKMTKKKKGLNSTKNKLKLQTKNSNIISSKDNKVDNFFKTNKTSKPVKSFLIYPKSQKQVKLDSLIRDTRRTGLTGQDDSGLDFPSKKDKSLPKIGMALHSQKNVSKYYSKRYLEKTRTEYDYLGSERGTDLSKFDVSRLSHGSMISNKLKKKVCIKKRKQEPLASIKKQKKSCKFVGAKAITAKKRKLETKKYFRSENPHLKTAPDIIKKSNQVPKENSIMKNRKEISIPKHLIKNLKTNKFSNKIKKFGMFSKFPASFRKSKKLNDKTIEGGNFGIFDFSVKPPSKGSKNSKEVKSYESLTRLFSQNPKKTQSKSNKRIGYSSSSLKKQRLTTEAPVEKKFTRCSTYNSQKMKINKVKLSSLAKNNPFKGKKKVFKGISSKYSSQKLKNFKNLTIDTFSPKNGFFKHKVLKNLTDKNKSTKGFFNDSMNNYFQIAGGLELAENPARSVGKANFKREKGSVTKKKNKVPQQVYNNIRMGDSNVKNKFIINIGNLPKTNPSNNKVNLPGKKYFEGFHKIEKEIQQILKFK